MNATMLTMLIKEHQDTLFQEVRKSRGVSSTPTGGSELQQRFLMRLGDALIATGLRLQGRRSTAAVTR
jgi:hypothetical protein